MLLHMRKYFLFIFIPVWCSAYAQQKNDSVFNAATLSSFPLTAISHPKSVSFLHFANPVPHSANPGKLSLFVFLSPECPLCQNYTRNLNDLQRQYADKMEIYGIIPGKAYGQDTVKAFAQKYKIGYPLFIDGSLRLSHYLQAEVTPECVLLNDKNELVYRGAIDNWLKELGKKRIHITENYLQDAIALWLQKGRTGLKRTKATGCLINNY